MDGNAICASRAAAGAIPFLTRTAAFAGMSFVILAIFRLQQHARSSLRLLLSITMPHIMNAAFIILTHGAKFRTFIKCLHSMRQKFYAYI